MTNSNEWYKILPIADGVSAINENGIVTMYLITGQERALLLDTGWGIGEIASLVNSMTHLPVTVMHTHGHIDHVSGAWQFDKVLVPKEDGYLLMQSYYTEERRFHQKIMLSGYITGSKAEKWINAKPANIEAVDSHSVFELGNRKISMYPFPGHTKGSSVFLDENTGILFVGDSIMAGAMWLHTEDSEPLAVYYNSLCSLQSIRARIKQLLPAHGKIPVEPEIIEELTSGVHDILHNKLTGSPTENHAGKGMLCEFEHSSIIYNPHNMGI